MYVVPLRISEAAKLARTITYVCLVHAIAQVVNTIFINIERRRCIQRISAELFTASASNAYVSILTSIFASLILPSWQHHYT